MSVVKKAAKSAAVIMVFTLVSKVLGFLRDMLTASKFGSGWETDTYFVALTASMMVTEIVGRAINTTVIPIFSEIEVKKGKEEKIKFTNNLINILFILSLLAMIIAWLLSPLIIKLMAQGFHGEQFNLAVKLNRIGLPIIAFLSIASVFSGFLESSQSFSAPAARGVILNFIYIIFLIFFSKRYKIEGLMAAGTLAAFSQILIQIPASKKIGYKYEFCFDLKDKYIKDVLSLTVPVIIGSAVNSVNTIIDRTIASRLVDGSISSLNYASKIQGLILNIFAVTVTTVIFPMLSNKKSNDDMDSLKEIMEYGINLIIILILPASIGLIILAKPIVGTFFERGAFDNIAVHMTSQALIFYSLGLLGASLTTMISSIYYSLHDTKTPMINGIFAVCLNIVLNLILVKFMAHRGLALATSISDIFVCILLIKSIGKKIHNFNIKNNISCFLKSLISSALMGILVYIIYYSVIGLMKGKLMELLLLVLTVFSGIIVYIILCCKFNIKEVKIITEKMRNKL